MTVTRILDMQVGRRDTLLSVRRFPAISLLAVIGFSLIAPVFAAAEPDSDLPACCRRNGHHQCAMMQPGESESGQAGPTLNRVPVRCREYPSSKAILVVPQKGVASRNAAPAIAPVFKQIGFIDRAEAHASFTSSETCPKRGPPSFTP